MENETLSIACESLLKNESYQYVRKHIMEEFYIRPSAYTVESLAHQKMFELGFKAFETVLKRNAGVTISPFENVTLEQFAHYAEQEEQATNK